MQARTYLVAYITTVITGRTAGTIKLGHYTDSSIIPGIYVAYRTAKPILLYVPYVAGRGGWGVPAIITSIVFVVTKRHR